MAIVDYSTLQASVANWLARADLGTVIPDFIQLGESRINRDLKIRRMMARASGTAVNGVIPLPADYSEMRSVRLAFANGMSEVFPEPATAEPAFLVNSGLPGSYSVEGDSIYLNGGQPDIAYLIRYWGKVPSLSSSNQQTWLLNEEPGIYLYAALVEASPYTRDDERTVLWATQYKSIVDRLISTDEGARYGNAPAMVINGATP